MTVERGLLENRLREERQRRGWSQDELARRSGLSRTGVSAIEMQRLVPSAAAALALAAAFECRVEDLFRLPQTLAAAPGWAWAPRGVPCRYWQAEIGGRLRCYPVEASPLGVVPHDGVVLEATEAPRVEAGGGILNEATATLVMAGCDPAVGLLSAVLARSAGVRLIALQRSSRSALELLRQGLVHVAGVHLTGADHPEGNDEVVHRELGPGYRLIRVARWDEGIAFDPSLKLGWLREALASDLRWVGREAGSGARQCLDALLGGRRPPRRVALDHRGVATAVQGGWADAGVCLRLVSEEAGLGFLAVRQEVYDLCVPDRWYDDRRVQALVAALRSPAYRRALAELPGYRSDDTGEVRLIRE
ncbi:MAG: helix-turn-helix domain-containing protein [Gemmataceae bacterium]|nr:helix-turn-helix domain-containing protein [Gemmataceae bacterium]